MKVAKSDEIRNSKLFNFRPFLFAAVCFCLGVTFCYLYVCHGVSAWWSLCAIPLSLTPFLFCRTRRQFLQRIWSVIWLTTIFFVGFFSFSYRVDAYQNCTHYNGESYVVGTVTDISNNGDITCVTLSDLIIEEDHAKGKLVAYLPSEDCMQLEISDKVLLTAKIKTEVELTDENGFRAWEIGEGIRYKGTYVSNVEEVGKTFNPFAIIRNRMQDRIYAGMDEESAAVTVAVLTGDSSGMETGLLTNMRAGGIAHIFAVSGLHVGALFAFCLGVLRYKRFRGIPKLVQFIGIAGLLFFYAGVCGFSPSIVRAAVICLVAYAAKLLLIETDFLETLGVAALLILCCQPTALFEVGFQLSFLSCLGIVLLARPIQNGCTCVCAKIRGVFPARKFTPSERKMLARGDTLPPSIPERIVKIGISFVAVSLAAQIATAPVQMYAFGYLSPLALILNCIFVPVLTCAFGILLLGVAVACLLPIGAATWVLGIPSMLWSGILLLFEYVDFSKFVLADWKVPLGVFVSYYTGCTFLSDKWNLKDSVKKWIAVICVVVCVICLVIANLSI